MVNHVLILLALVCHSAAISYPLSLNNPLVLKNLEESDLTTTKHVVVLANHPLLILRGGALEAEQSDGFVVTKLRNIIRGFLEIGEKKLPTVTGIFKGIVKSVESIAGIKLLPDPPPEKKKKKSKKKKKRAVVEESDEEVEDEADEADEEPEVAVVKKKKKKRVKKKAPSKPSAATQKHLSTKISAANPNYRVQRELKEFLKSPPPNLSVKVGSNIRIWIVTMEGADNTIYEGEVYKLRVAFPKDYPMVPPSVYFLAPTPQHEHVYTNGDICLSLLGKDWRPTMTAQSIAVSILSILSSASSKSLPMDNARHSQNKPGQYQKDWIYHDDNC